jgi:hypothetical protein
MKGQNERICASLLDTPNTLLKRSGDEQWPERRYYTKKRAWLDGKVFVLYYELSSNHP